MTALVQEEQHISAFSINIAAQKTVSLQLTTFTFTGFTCFRTQTNKIWRSDWWDSSGDVTCDTLSWQYSDPSSVLKAQTRDRRQSSHVMFANKRINRPFELPVIIPAHRPQTAVRNKQSEESVGLETRRTKLLCLKNVSTDWSNNAPKEKNEHTHTHKLCIRLPEEKKWATHTQWRIWTRWLITTFKEIKTTTASMRTNGPPVSLFWTTGWS